MNNILLDSPNQIALAQLAARKGALKLEISGLKMSRGISVYAICKKVYGLKGSKQKVLEQMEAMIEAALANR